MVGGHAGLISDDYWLSRDLAEGEDQTRPVPLLAERGQDARPYTWRLGIFSFVTWPSVRPLLHASAARTAAKSRGAIFTDALQLAAVRAARKTSAAMADQLPRPW